MMQIRVAQKTQIHFTRATHGDDSGAVLIWVALMTILLLGVSALAVDLGYAYSVKRQLSATSDSAALAGAQEAGLKFSDPGVGGCGSILDGLIVAAVNANHAANSPAGSTGNPNTTIECTDADGNPVTGKAATAITVKVDESSSLDTWFGRVLGSDTLNPNATATARVFGSTFLSGLRPFLVCLDDAKTARAEYEADTTPAPLFQSFYAKFDQSQTVPGAPAFNNVPWAASTDAITTAQNHGLANDEYVRLEKNGSGAQGASNGFYYVTGVVNNKKKEFKVSLTRGGTAVNITTDGTVDVFTPTPVAGGNSQWDAASDILTDAGHGLVDGTEVRVSVVSGVGGVNDGNYFVINATTDTFQLSADKINALTITDNMVINVYEVAIPVATGGGCNPATSPANWGYSAFDYTNGDDKQLACLIEFGYGGGPKCLEQYPVPPGVDVGQELTGVPAEGDQGNNLGKADGDLIRDLIIAGDPILLPVGNNWNGAGGNNAQYDGRGALSVTLCGYALPGNKPDTPTQEYYGACGDKAKYLQSVTDGVVTKDTSLAIQWIYATWVFGFQGQPSGSVDQCPLGSCVASLQLFK